MEPGYSRWVYLDCFDKDTFLKVLVTSYKEIRAATDWEGFDVSTPDAMWVHSSLPAQPPWIDESKVRAPVSVASLVKKLKGSRSC